MTLLYSSIISKMYKNILLKYSTILLFILAWFLSAYTLHTYAAVDIPGGGKITEASIWVAIANGTVDGAKDFWFRILWVVRLAISWLALVYLVMIGAYMILGSDSEDTIKKQRKQITYAIIGFLFLNVPNLVYTIFSWDARGPIGPGGAFSDTNGGSLFWNTYEFEGIFGGIIAFLRVFVFGAAVTMFTWGLFNLLVSGGDDEKKKMAKNRIVYGLIGLIFMGFVGLWWELVAVGNFTKVIPSVTGNIFSLVMYFVAPITIFMLIWGAYYFITSAGDEERMKKWKSILINTFIAVIILITALSFMTDLATFKL
jgi:hypothetical protein